MKENFLHSYLDAFGRIQGWFSPDAALMFMAYNQLIASTGISHNVLEIGVHHGLSAIAVASLRGENGLFFGVDLFEDLQSKNVSCSGQGNKAVFLSNMKTFFVDIGFVRPVTAISTHLKPSDLPGKFSFCHVDGGHSAKETYRDLELCHHILVPGGLVALDDYFNPAFPGVSEGALRFLLNHQKAVKPIAFGFNKVLFQKIPAPFDANAAFSAQFPLIPKTVSLFFDAPVRLFASSVSSFFDLARSTPTRLAPLAELTMRAVLEPRILDIEARPGQAIQLPIRIVNKSSLSFEWGVNPFGLSYHLLTSRGAVVQFDGLRNYFKDPLRPGEERVVDLTVLVPEAAGSYRVEVDMVWEGITWFKEKGNPTKFVNLIAA
jgi:predicted O-methyltransferase YrrM